MKNIFLILTGFVLALPSLAQTDKKYFKNIEKKAIALPSGSLVVEGAYAYAIESADTVYGRLNSIKSTGTSSFQAYTEEGEQLWPEYIKRMKLPVTGLYCSQTEVSNKDYWAFITVMRKNYPLNYSQYLPDTGLWNYAPYVPYYHRSVLFGNYPAVNITHKQALAYCNWLTEEYNNYSGRKYKKVRFRLPTEAEWMYAYLGGGTDFSVHNHGNLRNNKGLMLANFRRLKQTQIRFATDSAEFNIMFPKQNNDDALQQDVIITSPVVSYWPNDYDLYSMMGNVSEFVAEYGITKGGGWSSTGFYLMPLSRETYLSEATSAAPNRGFRWVMEVLEE